MFEITSESRRVVRVAIRGTYSAKDAMQLLDVLEKHSSALDPPRRYYLDFGDMTDFEVSYSDVMEQAKRLMKLQFRERVTFGVYSTSAVVRRFAAAFGMLIDSSKAEVIVSEDREQLERALT